MRVLIIGGTGLIGKATAGLLAQAGNEAVAAARRPPPGDERPRDVHWVDCDVTDADSVIASVDAVRPDAVVHLAAFLQFACDGEPAEAVRVNVDGTVHVLEACRKAAVPRLVFGSSIAVYGERTDLMREDDPPSAAISLYGETKRLGETLGIRYARLHGLTFLALRYSGVFGPGNVKSPGMALARQQLKATASGAPAVIEGLRGDERCHLTYVADAAAATARALAHPRPGHLVYNVAGPEDNYLSLAEFHEAVRAVAGTAGAAVFNGKGRQAGPVDLGRLRGDLGFDPQFTVLQGLRDEFAARPPSTADRTSGRRE